MVTRRRPLTERQWDIFRSRIEELAGRKADAAAPVRSSYFAEAVLLLMDRLDDLELRLIRSATPFTPVVRRRLAALTQEGWEAFLMEYRQYLIDGWGDLRAFRTALGTLLVSLEQKEKEKEKEKPAKGRQRRA